jgi:hypothetical protein
MTRTKLDVRLNSLKTALQGGKVVPIATGLHHPLASKVMASRMEMGAKEESLFLHTFTDGGMAESSVEKKCLRT